MAPFRKGIRRIKTNRDVREPLCGIRTSLALSDKKGSIGTHEKNSQKTLFWTSRKGYEEREVLSEMVRQC